MANNQIYNTFINNCTKDNFANLLQNITGEKDNIEFKTQWIDFTRVAKYLLAFGNYGGGIIIFGIKEDDGYKLNGIEEFKDCTKIKQDIANYVPHTLDYEIYDFNFNGPEYNQLFNTKFQVICVQNTPEYIPFMPMRDSKYFKIF